MKKFEVLFHVEDAENVRIQVEALHELLAIAKATTQAIHSGQIGGLKVVDVTISEISTW